MKHFITTLLALTLAVSLLWAAPALAQQESDPIAVTKSMLTEVYGYTAEEADAFSFSVTDGGEIWKISYWPKDHTRWSYYLEVGKADGHMVMDNAKGPFSTSYSGYPGQNAVQDVLRAARENGWFARWDDSARSAFSQKMTDAAVNQTGELHKGLATGEITAAQAIDGFFRSCYGNPTEWNDNVLEWRDEVLKENGLVLGRAEERRLTEGTQTYTSQMYLRSGYHMGTLTVTEFRGETPAELVQALKHPRLEGWTMLCGAYYTAQAAPDEPNPVADNGFLAFEKGEKRLLVMLVRPAGEDAWQLVPIGERALLPGREMGIVYDGSGSVFSIFYPRAGAESDCFRVLMAKGGAENSWLCKLVDYRRVNQETGEGIVIGNVSADRQLDDGWYYITTYVQGREPVEEHIEADVPGYLDYIDAEAFPKSLEECRAAAGDALPQGYGVACGVHLRKKTSSRSADLGDYYPGTLVRVLDILPGDPYMWAHVYAGQTEGYMSGIYVQYPGLECSMRPLKNHTPLPVAMARKEMALKKGTGWFDGTAAELPRGAKMHVMAARGDWLHVMVPQGEAGWLMDVNGTDGYVKAADVWQGATALQLDWLMGE